MDLHKILKPYAIDNYWYNREGYSVLIRTLLDYSNAHSWYHYFSQVLPDSNDMYFHCAVIYWTDGQRPTLNTFNFKREYITDCISNDRYGSD